MSKRRAGAATDQFVFRPRIGLVACFLWLALAVVWLAIEWRSGWADAAARLPLIGAISVAVFAVFGRPRVIVSATGVLLVNVSRDIDIPFGALAKVDTQYALTLTTVDGRRFQAWAAPASGRIGASRVTDEERKALSWNGPLDEIPSSAALRSDAGAVAVAIRRRWQPRADDPAASAPVIGVPGADLPPVNGQPQIRWATKLLVLFTVLVVAAAVVAIG